MEAGSLRNNRTDAATLVLGLRLIPAICIFLTAGAALAAAQPCPMPAAVSGEWETALPETVGLDGTMVCAIDGALDASPEFSIHAVLVLRKGKLVFETYRNGDDERWGSRLGTVVHLPETLHDQRSISKSVVSLLVGIAVDRGLVAGTRESVPGFFPEFSAERTPEKDRITLQHLLTMTSGLAWDERRPYTDPANSEVAMARAANPYQFVLAQPLAGPPGAAWNYNGGNTQLLAGIVQRSAKTWLDEFAREALFAPLGIKRFEWVRMPVSREAAAASGLRLRPRDMAKIGQLVLNEGMWEGRQVVSAAWIAESTTTHVSGFDPVSSIGYGYQWWTDHGRIGDRDIAWISAQGLGGQRIYVVPAHDLAVVISAGQYRDERHNAAPYEIFRNHVLSAIRD